MLFNLFDYYGLKRYKRNHSQETVLSKFKNETAIREYFRITKVMYKNRSNASFLFNSLYILLCNTITKKKNPLKFAILNKKINLKMHIRIIQFSEIQEYKLEEQNVYSYDILCQANRFFYSFNIFISYNKYLTMVSKQHLFVQRDAFKTISNIELPPFTNRFL